VWLSGLFCPSGGDPVVLARWHWWRKYPSAKAAKKALAVLIADNSNEGV